MSLFDFYSENWPRLVKLLRSEPRLSPPLLIDSADRLLRQPLRLFIVGQQTNTWYNGVVRIRESTAAITELQTIYEKFSLGLEHPSPFWQAVRELERAFGIKAGHVLWSNLNRADYESARPPRELEEQLLGAFPLLPAEIAVASPDVVVFFTGPSYDGLLSKAFPDAVITPVRGFDQALCNVRHCSLPKRAFRTYHPKFLRLRRKWSRILRAIVRHSGPE